MRAAARGVCALYVRAEGEHWAFDQRPSSVIMMTELTVQALALHPLFVCECMRFRLQQQS